MTDDLYSDIACLGVFTASSNEAEPDGVDDGRQEDEAQQEDVQEEVHVAARVEEHRDRLKK